MVKRFYKGLVWIAIGLVVAGAVTAGFLYWQKISFDSPTPATQAGIYFEDLLPSDVYFVMSYNPTDAQEQERFSKLLAVVLQDKKDSLPAFLATEFVHDNKLNVTLADLVTLFDKDSRFALAVSQNEDKKNPQLQFYFLFSVKNPDNAQKVLEKIEHSAKDSKTSVNFGIIGDVIYVTNAEKAAKKLKNRRTRSIFSFSSTRGFRRNFSKLQAPFSGYIFLNIEKDFVFPGFSPQQKISEDFDITQSSLVSLHALDDGLLMNTFSEIKKEPDEKSPFADLFKSYTASLYEGFPADNLAIFMEGHNLGSIILGELEAFKTSFNLNKEKILANFKTTTGFDFEKDILPFLKAGFAAAMYDAGEQIPAVILRIDISADEEKALAVVKKLDKHLPTWISTVNLVLSSEKSGPIIEKLEAPENMTAVKIYLNRIPKEKASIPLFQALKEPIAISYGTFGYTQNKTLFISTASDKFHPQKVMEDSQLFKDASQLGIAPGNLVFIDSSVIGNYVSRLISEAQTEEKFSQKVQEVFDILKKHLLPIKSFVQVSNGDGKSTFGKAFLKIVQ